jgi:hypothetical protein
MNARCNHVSEKPVGFRFLHSDLLGRRYIADYEAEQVGEAQAKRHGLKAREMVLAVARKLIGEVS